MEKMEKMVTLPISNSRKDMTSTSLCYTEETVALKYQILGVDLTAIKITDMAITEDGKGTNGKLETLLKVMALMP